MTLTDQATPDRPREARLRRHAAGRGLRVVKHPTRNRFAAAYGTFHLVDAATGATVAGPGLTLGDLELALASAPDGTRQEHVVDRLWREVLPS